MPRIHLHAVGHDNSGSGLNGKQSPYSEYQLNTLFQYFYNINCRRCVIGSNLFVALWHGICADFLWVGRSFRGVVIYSLSNRMSFLQLYDAAPILKQ